MFYTKFLPYGGSVVTQPLAEVSTRVLRDASQQKGWLSCFRENRDGQEEIGNGN